MKVVISDYEAGVPTDLQVRWISLSPAKIQRRMESVGEEISYYLTCSILKEMGYRKRRYSKEQGLSELENRDAQFNKIALLKKAFSEQKTSRAKHRHETKKRCLVILTGANLITEKRNVRP